MEEGMIIRAEWPGYVVDVLVAPGQEVEEDETLILMEGTDSSHTPFYVSAPESGKVMHILLEEGDFAEEDDDLLELAEAD
jgi:biotin carboxyl carrier protein